MSPRKNIIFVVSMLFISAIIVYVFQNYILLPKKIDNSVPIESPTSNGNKIDETKTKNIIVDNLTPDQKITSPLEITGQARNWYFEAQFPIKLVDQAGKIIAQTAATAQGEWMTSDFVPFKATLEFNVPKETAGTLIFQNDNPSDIRELDESYEIPVTLIPVNVSIVKAYFTNSQKDPDFLDCSVVFPVERVISKTPAVARGAIEELLKGPTEKEKREGFVTSINEGVKIQRLTIDNGAAKIDFNDKLSEGGGSCWVQANIAQITETLKQFPTVKNVEITVNGQTDPLQP